MVRIVYVHVSMKELKELTKVATALQGAMSFIPEMKHIFEGKEEKVPDEH